MKAAIAAQSSQQNSVTSFVETLASPTYATRPGASLSVSLHDRWLIPGVTGCGKTKFTRRLLEVMRSFYPHCAIYVLDSKGCGDYDDYPGIYEGHKAPQAIGPGQTLTWIPPTDDLHEYDRWFENIREARRPAVVVIDELSSIAPNPQSCPPGYQKLLKQGRKPGISVVSCTQEACYIPRQAYNQTTHLVRFTLNDDYDSRKVDRLMGRLGTYDKVNRRRAAPPDPGHKHGFFYCRVDQLPRRVHEYSHFGEFF